MNKRLLREVLIDVIEGKDIIALFTFRRSPSKVWEALNYLISLDDREIEKLLPSKYGVDASYIKHRLQSILDYLKNLDEKNPYAVLNVNYDVPQSELKRKWKELMVKWHPDKHGGSAESYERVREINQAYELLKNPEKRREYDRLHVPLLEILRQIKASGRFHEPVVIRKRHFLVKPVFLAVAVGIFIVVFVFLFQSKVQRSLVRTSVGREVEVEKRKKKENGVKTIEGIQQVSPEPVKVVEEEVVSKAKVVRKEKSEVTKVARMDAGVLPGVRELKKKETEKVSKKVSKKEPKLSRVKSLEVKKTQVRKKVRHRRSSVARVVKPKETVGVSKKTGSVVVRKIEKKMEKKESEAGSFSFKEPVKVVEDFIDAYKSEDIGSLFSLFSQDALENGKPVTDFIDKYKFFFDNFLVLDYQVLGRKVLPVDGGVEVKGKYILTIAPKSGGTITSIQGVVSWFLVKEETGEWVIKRLNFTMK